MQFAKPSLARKTSPGHSRNSFARYATSIIGLRYQPGELGKWPVLVSEHWLQMAKPVGWGRYCILEAAHGPGCGWKRNGEVHGRFVAFHLPLGPVGRKSPNAPKWCSLRG